MIGVVIRNEFECVVDGREQNVNILKNLPILWENRFSLAFVMIKSNGNNM
jgi:hypothetical protein